MHVIEEEDTCSLSEACRQAYIAASQQHVENTFYREHILNLACPVLQQVSDTLATH